MNLNGTWQFAFDDEEVGLKEKWQTPGTVLPKEITVPFCYQCSASGIGDPSTHPVLWYRRSFRLTEEMAGKHVRLCFGAVDFECHVYINGTEAGSHRGGYTPFSMDITHLLQDGDNDLCVLVRDDADCAQPRGKQFWQDGLMGCWYTPVSGIWQTVYLEATGKYSLNSVHITPDIDQGVATFELRLNRAAVPGMTAEVRVSFDGKTCQDVTCMLPEKQAIIPVSLFSRGRGLDTIALWSPGKPQLYDAEVRLFLNGEEQDHIHTYFGMRKVEVRNGQVLLNNHPLYQRLVLDQGYWPDTLLTPPSDDAIRKDVELTLALGFNGARKHQKIEDPRYYYWADRLGLLVWGELPSAYDFGNEMMDNMTATMEEFIERDYNHPSIITWTPINESWGVWEVYQDKRQQEAVRTLYHLCKSHDSTRLVSGNDGWEQVATDICALHDYAATGEAIAAHFASRDRVEETSCDVRMCWAKDNDRKGTEAFMVTEYGGIAFSTIGKQGNMGGMETWGYHDKVTDEESFFARYLSVQNAILELPYCMGYCYTQLTDVMQEINGLLMPDRTPKVDMKRFAEANSNPIRYRQA